MTSEEFKGTIKLLKAAFLGWDLSPESEAVWFMVLGDMRASDFRKIVLKYIKTQKWAPKAPADLGESFLLSLANDNSINESDAWDKLWYEYISKLQHHCFLESTTTQKHVQMCNVILSELQLDDEAMYKALMQCRPSWIDCYENSIYKSEFEKKKFLDTYKQFKEEERKNAVESLLRGEISFDELFITDSKETPRKAISERSRGF